MAIVLEESTKQDIKDWSHDLLVSSRCIGTFPTPANRKIASLVCQFLSMMGIMPLLFSLS